MKPNGKVIAFPVSPTKRAEDRELINRICLELIDANIRKAEAAGDLGEVRRFQEMRKGYAAEGLESA